MKQIAPIAEKLFRLIVLRLVVGVTARIFGPSAESADAQCVALDHGRELSVPGGCGKRRIAIQTKPNGIIYVGFFVSQEGITENCLAEAARWRQMLLNEVRALDECEDLGGWAVGRVRVFVSRKDNERSEAEPLITIEAET